MGSARSAEVGRALQSLGSPERAAREKAYLKSDLTHYGVPVPDLHALARTIGRGLDRDEVLALVTDLWDEPPGSPVHERRFVAADVLATRSDVLRPPDLALLDRLVRQARTWAIVDTLAPRVVGPLLERFPDDVTPVLDRWVQDEDRWIRRSVLLAHLIPLRDGRGDWPLFTRYADVLARDREFFVAKALGWVLRDTGRRRPELVVPWLDRHITTLSPVAVREALKPLAPHDQARLRQARAPGG